MNPDTAKIIAEGFLRGAFDVLEAMLPVDCASSIDETMALTPDLAGEFASSYPVALQGRIQGGLGSVAMLLTVGEASHLAALIQEQEPETGDTLSDADRGLMQEVAEPALGGGVTNVMERFGRAVEQLEEVVVEDASAEGLIVWLGADPVAALFSFKAGELSGQGVLMYSASIEDLAPADLSGGGAGEGAPPIAEPSLSAEEMGDILSGFGPVPEMAEGNAGAAPAPAASRPENLGLILDIQLNAIARLGRVEMPIGDILNLGPGSIIEVGHLVDEPIELLINDKLIARGDVVVVDEKFGLRITEVVSPQVRIESLR